MRRLSIPAFGAPILSGSVAVLCDVLCPSLRSVASASAEGASAVKAHQSAPSYKTTHQGQGRPAAAASGPQLSSCAEDVGPVVAKPLSALQKRMLEKKDKAIFSLTPNAVYRVKNLMAMHKELKSSSASTGGEPVGIRIGVKKRGCSGYSYTVNYEYDTTAKKPQDSRVDQSGVSVFVDGDALFYVVGTVMDFTVSNVEEKFTFANPNQKYQCGCGESFMPFDV